MRRRLHHGDVDGKKHEHLVGADLDDLNEPLLGNNEDYKANQLEVQKLEDIFYDEKSKERLHWTFSLNTCTWQKSFIPLTFQKQSKFM
ncbi:hypothetical protein L1987_21552 [Smallanthus sonchifolius]|uniref:Uncharacterized protein n=1 Tax=Smallanthus sonchifolius TaxID=185202 RepID=A0ACB9IWT1_9ASTR|nr:hypothetical protein L1987_21552 [Smallanthus sonchifolius]